MKRVFVLVFVLVFCFGSAAAESNVTLEFSQLPAQSEAGNSYAYFANSRYETLVRMNSNEGKVLVNLEGEPISAVYQEMVTLDRVCRVYDGNRWGLISAQTGEVLVPCQYDQTESLYFLYGENDGSWNLGIDLEAGTSEDHDYRDAYDSSKYYRITHTDLYHGTEIIASFTREEYSSHSSISLMGKYIWFCPDFYADRTYNIYDTEFHLLKTGIDSVREYEEDFRTSTVIHVPTGERVFTEGCTLTEADVFQPYRYMDGKIIGLDGQVICAPEKEYSFISVPSLSSEYFRVEKDNRDGLINRQGQEIIPCICDELPNDGFFEEDYLPASVDGKLVFFDASGIIVTETGLDAEQVTMINHVFGSTEAEDGGYRIFSAAVGFLEGNYSYPDTAVGNLLFLANDADQYGVLDEKGNEVLPFDGSWVGFTVFAQDTVLLARDAEYNYCIARLPQD